MEQNNSQQHPPMTPDRAKAALGNATLLQSFLLPRAQQQQPAQGPAQQPAEEQGQPLEEVKTSLKDMETKFIGELDTLKDMIEKNAPKDRNKELEDLKKQINDVLKESDDDDQTIKA